jgi:D-psicose/D-tagatose/L-ribulose 3-epimerase
MKYAIHLSSFTKAWAEDLIPYIQRASEIGYDGVELPLMDPYSFDSDTIRKALAENNLVALCGTGLNPDADISSEDRDVRAKGEAHLIKCIDCCKAIGSKQLGGVLYAPWGQLKPRNEAVANYHNIVESLRKVADYAKKSDVTLCLEVLNRYETYVINTIEEGLALIEEIGRDNVKLHVDTFHAHIEENDIYRAIVKGSDKIHYIHFSENTRGIPLTGQVAWDKVAQALKAIGYTGWVGGEYFVNCNCEVGNGCMIWRQIHEDGDYAARQGLINVKTVLE